VFGWLVRKALGPLAADTEPAARLRETLQVFLAEKGSYLATAERLHLHENAVKYRVDKALGNAAGRSTTSAWNSSWRSSPAAGWPVRC
jgi:sugar diacid utilization regulator